MLSVSLSIVIFLWLGITSVVFLASDGAVAISGSVGDSFGAVNALFSALAFAFLIYTALLQREELRLQREELRLTREEFAKSAKAQMESADAQAKILQVNAQQLELERMLYSKQVTSALAIASFMRKGGIRKVDEIVLQVYYNKLRYLRTEADDEILVSMEPEENHWYSPDDYLTFNIQLPKVREDYEFVIIYENAASLETQQVFKVQDGNVTISEGRDHFSGGSVEFWP